MFEPSAGGDPDLFRAALEIADVIKYSDERFATLPPHKARVSRRLEVQTFGAAGLRYRMGEGRRLGTWRHLRSIKTASVVDTAGAGDWCTAGMLTHLGGGGREGFEQVTDDKLAESLRYGQALAAWNCGFESARGGMYERTRKQFESDVAALMAGNNQVLPSRLDSSVGELLGEICPACPMRGEDGAKTPKKVRLAERRT